MVDISGYQRDYGATNEIIASTWLRKLAYVVPISLRYPRSEGTTNFRRPRESGDLEPAPGMNRGRPNEWEASLRLHPRQQA